MSSLNSPQGAPSPFLPCEHTAKRHPSKNQEVGAHQALNLLALDLGLLSSQICEENACCLSHPGHSTLLQQPRRTET